MSHQLRYLFVGILVGVVCIPNAKGSQFLGLGGSESGVIQSQGYAVSGNGGAVVGRIDFEAGTQAFRWTPDSGLQVLAGTRQGFGVSGDGQVVVGDGRNPNSNVVEPIRWAALGGVQFLGGPPGATLDFATGALDASYDGNVIVGQTKVGRSAKAFRWTVQDGVELLGFEGPNDESAAGGVSDDGRVVVGALYPTFQPTVAFRWTVEDGVTFLPTIFGGLGNSLATDLSPDGSIVIGEASTPKGTQAFRWTEATGMVLLNNQLGGLSTAYGVTTSGEAIVGTAGVRAFVWTANRGMELLSKVLSDRFDIGAQLAGWQLYEARDISADGRTIVGSGVNPSGQYQAWVARLDVPIFVPEPNAACLAVAPVLVAGATWRRSP